MGRMLSPVLRELCAAGKDYGRIVAFRCPGCFSTHAITIEKPAGVIGPCWEFDGNAESPTFSPSILARGMKGITDDQHKLIMSGGVVDPEPVVCHSFVRGGQIQFLGDCTHALANKTVEIPKWEADLC